jgi:A/G-specific adenine glycosylase
MDYGAHLKQSGIKLNEKKVGYRKQSTFKGSDREIRGAIVRTLTQNKHATLASLTKIIGHERMRIAAQLEQLQKEELVEKDRQHWNLVS